MVCLKGALLTLPSFCTSESKEFCRFDSALRVILTFANGGIAHFLLCGSGCGCAQLAVTNKLLEAFVGDAGACGTGQLVSISGDVNAEPCVIPLSAKLLDCGHLVDLEGACADGRGVPHSPTCRFDLDGAPGTRRDSCLVCLNALASGAGGGFFLTGGFALIFRLAQGLLLGSDLRKSSLLG